MSQFWDSDILSAEAGLLPELGGVILCGGASQRMGTTKAALRLGGVTLLEWVARALLQVAGAVVVVAAPDNDSMDSLQAILTLSPRLILCHDESLHPGPLHGLLVGLEALPHSTTHAFLAACDMPLLRADWIRLFHQQALTSEADIVTSRSGDRPQPFASVYRKALRHQARQLLADTRAGLIHLHQGNRVLELPESLLRRVDPNLESLMNCNTAEDFRALESYWRKVPNSS